MDSGKKKESEFKKGLNPEKILSRYEQRKCIEDGFNPDRILRRFNSSKTKEKIKGKNK